MKYNYDEDWESTLVWDKLSINKRQTSQPKILNTVRRLNTGLALGKCQWEINLWPMQEGQQYFWNWPALLKCSRCWWNWKMDLHNKRKQYSVFHSWGKFWKEGNASSKNLLLLPWCALNANHTKQRFTANAMSDSCRWSQNILWFWTQLTMLIQCIFQLTFDSHEKLWVNIMISQAFSRSKNFNVAIFPHFLMR